MIAVMIHSLIKMIQTYTRLIELGYLEIKLCQGVAPQPRLGMDGIGGMLGMAGIGGMLGIGGIGGMAVIGRTVPPLAPFTNATAPPLWSRKKPDLKIPRCCPWWPYTFSPRMNAE